MLLLTPKFAFAPPLETSAIELKVVTFTEWAEYIMVSFRSRLLCLVTLPNVTKLQPFETKYAKSATLQMYTVQYFHSG